MTHLQFVILAYAITAIILLGLTGWIFARKLQLQKKLKRLKAEQQQSLK